MTMRVVGFFAALAAIAMATLMPAAARQNVEPAKLLSAPQPTYPPQAWSARVEGDVRFKATLRPDGTVDAIEILAVPEANLGFEDAAKAAVASWRFQPATLNGRPTAFEYTGSLRFALTFPGQAIFAASTQNTWDAALAVVRQLGLRVRRADPVDRILIANGKYDPTKLLTAQQLNLPPGSVDATIALHIMVAPDLEPARVAVGVEMDVLSARRAIQLQRRYGNTDIARLLLSRMAARMQVKMEPLSASAGRRAEQSRALMPPGINDTCSVVPAALVEGEHFKQATRTPKLVSQVAAVYPSDQRELKRQGTIWFVAELTEHGTLVDPQNTIHADDSGQLVLAAQMAASLWRFRPVVKDGCPARSRINIEQKFILRK